MLFSIFAGQVYILGWNLNHYDNYGVVYLVFAVIRYSHIHVGNFYTLSSFNFVYLCCHIQCALCTLLYNDHGHMMNISL